MRLFIGLAADEIDFDPSVPLKRLRASLDKKKIDYRWVPSANYHITLSFLGDVEPERVDLLKVTLASIMKHHSPFRLRVQGFGAFPRVRSGKVLWLDVQHTDELRLLQEKIYEELQRLDFRVDEKPFSPHITVARLATPRNVSEMITPLALHHFGEMTVRRVTLFQSKTTSPSPTYLPLEEFPLGKGESKGER